MLQFLVNSSFNSEEVSEYWSGSWVDSRVSYSATQDVITVKSPYFPNIIPTNIKLPKQLKVVNDSYYKR